MFGVVHTHTRTYIYNPIPPPHAGWDTRSSGVYSDLNCEVCGVTVNTLGNGPEFKYWTKLFVFALIHPFTSSYDFIIRQIGLFSIGKATGPGEGKLNSNQHNSA